MSTTNPLCITLVVLLCYSGCCLAFGAGNVPQYPVLQGRAFRHGDIEEILAEMLIRAADVGANLVGFAVKEVGKKFSIINIKRTYFGNWLRDYSQALDVGTLSRGLDIPLLRVLVWVLGFMQFGYATEEFEVTEENLGVYRPEEHIDNPKHYADNMDARAFDPRLRGPVDPREVEVDPRTGMKNYICNEDGGWVTSTQYIRDSLVKAIHLGRYGATDPERCEALRLLGQALHTLEDLTSHSNWIELALIELGYPTVFPHVGINSQIQVLGSDRYIWPLVTGTLGGTDCLHSLLGEATEKISQTCLSDLIFAVSGAEQEDPNQLFKKLKRLLKPVPLARPDLGKLQEMGQASAGQVFHLQGTAGSGQAIALQEIANNIHPVFAVRDKIVKDVNNQVEQLPELKESLDEISFNLNYFVLTIIHPFITPVMRLVSENVTTPPDIGIDDPAKYIVWNDPYSTDPTHSMLAKDHFSLYLNEPAGLVAKVIISFTISNVVAAWSNETIDPHLAVNSILECFCHPAFLSPTSKLQQSMLSTVNLWIDSLPPIVKARVLDGLSSEGVREGRNYDEEKRNAGKPVQPPSEPEPIEVPAPTQVPVPDQIVTTVTRDIVDPVAPIQSFGTAAMVVNAAASVVRNPFHWVNYSEIYDLAQQYGPMSDTTLTTRSVPTDIYTTEPTYTDQIITIPTRLWPYNTDFYLHPDSQKQQPYEVIQPQYTPLQYTPLVNGPLQSYVPPPQQIEPPPRRTSTVAFHSYGRIPDHTSVDDVAPDSVPIVQQVGSYVVAPPESSRHAQAPVVTTARRTSMNFNTYFRPVSATDTAPQFPPPVQQQETQYTAEPQQTTTSFNTGRRESKMAFHSYLRPVNVPDTPAGEVGSPQYVSPNPQPEGAPRPIATTETAPGAPFNTGRRESKLAFHTYFRPTNDPNTPAEGPSQPFPPVAQSVQAPVVGTPQPVQTVQPPVVGTPLPYPSPPVQPPIVTGNPWASQPVQQQVPPVPPPSNPPVQEMRSLSLDSGRRPSTMTFHKYFQADHS